MSAAHLTTLVVIVVLAMLGYSVKLQFDMDRLASAQVVLKQQQQSIADELGLANAELSKLLADTQMDNQIVDVSRQIRASKRVLNFVDSNQFGAGQGFSEYLISLSNLHVENVWLDEIKLTENYVRILGSSLKAELIPAYFDRFSEEKVFEGNRFDVFRLQRNKEADWKVDFEIATGELLDD